MYKFVIILIFCILLLVQGEGPFYDSANHWACYVNKVGDCCYRYYNIIITVLILILILILFFNQLFY